MNGAVHEGRRSKERNMAGQLHNPSRAFYIRSQSLRILKPIFFTVLAYLGVIVA